MRRGGDISRVLPINSGHFLQSFVCFLIEAGEFGKVTAILFYISILVVRSIGWQLGWRKAKKLHNFRCFIGWIGKKILCTHAQNVFFGESLEPTLQLQIIEAASYVRMMPVRMSGLPGATRYSMSVVTI